VANARSSLSGGVLKSPFYRDIRRVSAKI